MFLMTLKQSEATVIFLNPQSSARANASEHAIASKVSGSIILGSTKALAAMKSP